MLSASFNISEFLKKVSTCDFQDIIYLTDQEATAAERCLYQGVKCAYGSTTQLQCYSTALKDFILFMRHGVKSRSIQGLDLSPFSAARREN